MKSIHIFIYIIRPEEGSARECLEGETRGEYDDECIGDDENGGGDDDDDGIGSGKPTKIDKV